MLEAGIEINHNKPKLLASEILDEAERMINIGCINSEACLAHLVTTEDGGLLDPERKSLEEVIQIQDEIRGRVSKLLDEV
jgi:protein-tyrosine-phosphatase